MKLLRLIPFATAVVAFAGTQTIEINYSRPTTPAPLQLSHGKSITLRVINKSPFSSCEVNAKREIIPPLDTLGDIIKMLSTILPGVAGFPVGPMAPPPPVSAITQPAPPPPPSPSALDTIEHSQIEKAKAMHAVGCKLLGGLKALNGFFGSDYGPNNQAKYKTDLATRSAAAKNLLNETADPTDRTGPFEIEDDNCLTTVSLSSEEFRRLLERDGLQTADTAARLDLLKRIYVTSPPQPGEAVRFGHAEAVQVQLEALRAAIVASRQELAKRAKYLAGLQSREDKGKSFVFEYQFNGENNIHRAGTVSCKDDISGDPAMEEIPIDLTWQDTPRASLSAGVLVSTMQKRVFSLGVTPDDISSGKVVSNTVQLDVSRPQIVPFSWVNIKIVDWHAGKYGIAISPGAGVNPNSGSNEVEFAVGPSLRWGKVYLFGGAHFGRQAEIGPAFPVNSHVPAGGFTLPISHSWEKKFGFGISYQLVPSK